MLSLAVVLLAALVGARYAPATADRATSLLASRWAPAVVGLLTTVAWWSMAGALTPLPLVHDEASYLLQAQTFARFRWTMPSPPIPEFFEQFHVFVQPAFASKYPPGHGLLMVPGVWLGLPFLMPMLLHGVSGAFVFLLARRVANPWVALVTWLLWLIAADNLLFRSRYYSEATSGALWLVGWWALLEWRRTRHRGWLLALSACAAWGAITRPLTMLAFAIPVAAVVLYDVFRLRLWRDTALATALGIGIVAIMPLWSQGTLGTTSPTPYSLYSELYFPFDRMGFGMDTTPPVRALPPDMVMFRRYMMPGHRGYDWNVLPRAYRERLAVVTQRSGEWKLRALLWLAVAGLVVAGASTWFAVGSGLLLLAAYLSFAHGAEWSIYYLEITMVVPFLVACGAWWVVTALRERRIGRTRAERAASLHAVPAGAALAGAVMAFALALYVPGALAGGRRAHRNQAGYHQSAHAAVAKLPGEKLIVFVRYATGHNPHQSLIFNQADLPGARVWWVYDRGTDNARLLRVAGDRTPYLLDEGHGWLGPLADAPRPSRRHLAVALAMEKADRAARAAAPPASAALASPAAP